MDGFIFSRAFWGIVVILIGLSIVLNAIFKINLPIFKILIALFFIYIGVRMLMGVGGVNQSIKTKSVFSQQKIEIKNLENKSFKAVFSDQTLDLSHIKLSSSDAIEVDAVFSSVELILPAEAKVVLMPENVMSSIKTIRINSNDSSSYELRIKAKAVFSEIKIIQERL